MSTLQTTHSLPSAVDGGVPETQKAPSSAAPSLSLSSDDSADDQDNEPLHRRRASTKLIAQNARDIQRITGETTAEFVGRCCGGGCCLMAPPGSKRRAGLEYEQLVLPDNDAFRALRLNITEIPTVLSKIAPLPPKLVSFSPIRRPASPSSPTDSAISLGSDGDALRSMATANDMDRCTKKTLARESGNTDGGVDTSIQPPSFVQPHPPYHVFPARIHSARELTNPGAEKRTFHFDLDVSDYPDEEKIEFKVGGAIGVTAPNDDALVQDVLDALMVPHYARDRPVRMATTGGRWPTVWGEEEARELVTTRRDVLTWCADLQSYPPTKPLLRVLAEHAADDNERKILMFLCAAEGQATFCDLRTGPHITVPQLLHAFPSSCPPLDELLSCLQQLMPRFYSLSNDPHESFQIRDQKRHRLIEVAVTVHETDDWRGGKRTGVGSGYFERQARRFLAAQKASAAAASAEAGAAGAAGADQARGPPELFIPMFKGLMANPLAQQFNADGPMLLIGAGVGIAPFRGFVQRRLKQANCANKVWVLQGIRDSLLDELYSGEWGVHEEDLKRVVQSRRGEGKYVQEEVRHQADLVWTIINAVDGRIFVCGSSKGMGEGVEQSLVDVAMAKGNLQRDEAHTFWNLKKEAGQYIAETW
ncbi:putative FAD-binding protein [Escovopsis weberi]|uniref:Putative FAD-binding protein n=1 Tax=Escovopsis weberi TaxID=150374 RepID=A0A0M8MQQ1_ESCWE|nr:putative FAD-binding protein [Escovopsis weberi]